MHSGNRNTGTSVGAAIAITAIITVCAAVGAVYALDTLNQRLTRPTSTVFPSTSTFSPVLPRTSSVNSGITTFWSSSDSQPSIAPTTTCTNSPCYITTAMTTESYSSTSYNMTTSQTGFNGTFPPEPIASLLGNFTKMTIAMVSSYNQSSAGNSNYDMYYSYSLLLKQKIDGQQAYKLQITKDFSSVGWVNETGIASFFHNGTAYEVQIYGQNLTGEEAQSYGYSLMSPFFQMFSLQNEVLNPYYFPSNNFTPVNQSLVQIGNAKLNETSYSMN